LGAAANRVPAQSVVDGLFREGREYRIHVIPVTLPRLRDRDEDMLEIANTFLSRFSEEEGKEFESFEADAKLALKLHTWPGNVRELQNTIRHIVVMNAGSIVTADMVRLALHGTQIAKPVSPMPADVSHADLSLDTGNLNSANMPVLQPLWKTERDAIEAAITLCDGNIQKAARYLEINPSTIYRKRDAWEKRAEAS